MLIDFHTHVFPPEVVAHRDDYIRRDPTFAELYSNPRARLATADDLIAEMNRAGVDRSIVLGFAWTDPEICARHNDYLLEVASRADRRLIPFCTIQPLAGEVAWREAERCAAAGALGLGELRPQNQGYRLSDSLPARVLADIARHFKLLLLLHASEPVGHSYPGKQGQPLDDLYRFCRQHPDLTVVAAHWGGGLAFYYPFMPELVREAPNLYFDTAATPFLYSESVYEFAARFLMAERLLMGSDFPLIQQLRQRQAIEKAGISEADRDLILGGNARRLLGLKDNDTAR